MIFSGLGEDPD